MTDTSRSQALAQGNSIIDLVEGSLESAPNLIEGSLESVPQLIEGSVEVSVGLKEGSVESVPQIESE
jgi:hypothetical protein